MKSTAFTFGTLLTIYLAGLGIGSAGGSVLLRHVRHPGRAFLGLQAFVGLYAGASLAALVSLLPASTALWTYLGGYEPLSAVAGFETLWSGDRESTLRSKFIALYFVLPVMLVGPPTLAMGASFPLLQKVALVDPDQIGKRVALVLIANIWGCTVGSIVTGWLALTYLGSAGSLKVMMALGGVFLALTVAAGRRGSVGRRQLAAVGVLLLVTAATARLPSGHRLWASLHGAPAARIVAAEDATGLSLLKANAAGAVVFVNGIGQSWIPYGNIHSLLGALPAFLHPNPRTAAIIGLGSGDTVYALAGRAELSRVTCIEIIQPQLTTLKEWARRTRYPGLLALLADPRVEHVSGDGRSYIMRSARTFDIIEADALRPASAYSGNLYSLGYFTLLRSRLAPGGMAVTWAPTTRVRDTFTAVFPHVLSLGDILIGSENPVHFDPNEIRARVRAPDVQAYYWRAGSDIEALVARSLNASPERSGHEPQRRNGDLNDDLYPRDEFSVPRSPTMDPKRGSLWIGR
jgi:hypothetical protein